MNNKYERKLYKLYGGFGFDFKKVVANVSSNMPSFGIDDIFNDFVKLLNNDENKMKIIDFIDKSKLPDEITIAKLKEIISNLFDKFPNNINPNFKNILIDSLFDGLTDKDLTGEKLKIVNELLKVMKNIKNEIKNEIKNKSVKLINNTVDGLFKIFISLLGSIFKFLLNRS